ncbi:hypothetical protein cypCar_00032213 [Cyprinus carpio]|nr:hypothetical protein cypCar_00032213 [Cyprinus carpio]
MQCGCLFPCAHAQTGEYATDEEGEAGQTGTDRDVAIEVFELPENEDIISPSELDATKLYQKFRELQIKHTVTEAEIQKLKNKLATVEKEKARWEREKTQLKQSIEENKERMLKLESYWIEAQTLCHTVNEHLKEAQSQYQALEKKYNKAKKLIKDFQQREMEFAQREDAEKKKLEEAEKAHLAEIQSLQVRQNEQYPELGQLMGTSGTHPERNERGSGLQSSRVASATEASLRHPQPQQGPDNEGSSASRDEKSGKKLLDLGSSLWKSKGKEQDPKGSPSTSSTGHSAENSPERCKSKILDDAPPPKLYQWQNRSVTEWTCQQVSCWLMGLNLEQYVSLFTAKNVDGEQLMKLDSSALKALGVESSQDRALIKKKLKDLKVLMEKARRNREKIEKQRKKELEQVRKNSNSSGPGEGATE